MSDSEVTNKNRGKNGRPLFTEQDLVRIPTLLTWLIRHISITQKLTYEEFTKMYRSLLSYRGVPPTKSTSQQHNLLKRVIGDSTESKQVIARHGITWKAFTEFLEILRLRIVKIDITLEKLPKPGEHTCEDSGYVTYTYKEPHYREPGEKSK